MNFENVIFKAIAEFFHLMEKLHSALEEFNFFTFITIPSTLKIVVSWWVLTHEFEYISEYLFWIVNHLDIKYAK